MPTQITSKKLILKKSLLKKKIQIQITNVKTNWCCFSKIKILKHFRRIIQMLFTPLWSLSNIKYYPKIKNWLIISATFWLLSAGSDQSISLRMKYSQVFISSLFQVCRKRWCLALEWKNIITSKSKNIAKTMRILKKWSQAFSSHPLWVFLWYLSRTLNPMTILPLLVFLYET